MRKIFSLNSADRSYLSRVVQDAIVNIENRARPIFLKLNNPAESELMFGTALRPDFIGKPFTKEAIHKSVKQLLIETGVEEITVKDA